PRQVWWWRWRAERAYKRLTQRLALCVGRVLARIIQVLSPKPLGISHPRGRERGGAERRRLQHRQALKVVQRAGADDVCVAQRFVVGGQVGQITPRDDARAERLTPALKRLRRASKPLPQHPHLEVMACFGQRD